MSKIFIQLSPGWEDMLYGVSGSSAWSIFTRSLILNMRGFGRLDDNLKAATSDGIKHQVVTPEQLGSALMTTITLLQVSYPNELKQLVNYGLNGLLRILLNRLTITEGEVATTKAQKDDVFSSIKEAVSGSLSTSDVPFNVRVSIA